VQLTNRLSQKRSRKRLLLTVRHKAADRAPIIFPVLPYQAIFFNTPKLTSVCFSHHAPFPLGA